MSHARRLEDLRSYAMLTDNRSRNTSDAPRLSSRSPVRRTAHGRSHDGSKPLQRLSYAATTLLPDATARSTAHAASSHATAWSRRLRQLSPPTRRTHDAATRLPARLSVANGWPRNAWTASASRPTVRTRTGRPTPVSLPAAEAAEWARLPDHARPRGWDDPEAGARGATPAEPGDDGSAGGRGQMRESIRTCQLERSQRCGSGPHGSCNGKAGTSGSSRIRGGLATRRAVYSEVDCRACERTQKARSKPSKRL